MESCTNRTMRSGKNGNIAGRYKRRERAEAREFFDNNDDERQSIQESYKEVAEKKSACEQTRVDKNNFSDLIHERCVEE